MSTPDRISRLIDLDRNLRGVAATRDAGDPYGEAVWHQLNSQRQALIARMTPVELDAYELERHRIRELLRGTI